MVTPSGVQFEGSGRSWKAVLPQGSYLPESLVVEQTQAGLSAHLQAPLDQSFVFGCSQRPDGMVVVDMGPDQTAEVLFHPDSLYYGVRSGGHCEGYRANGNWLYDWQSRDRTYQAEQTVSGELVGRQLRGDKTIPMAAEISGHRLKISEDKTSLRDRIAEHGFFSGLRLAMDCWTSGALGTFFFRDRTELFPNLALRAGHLRQEMEASTRTAERIAAPKLAYTGIRETDQSVSIGGVVLRRATRIDPLPGS